VRRWIDAGLGGGLLGGGGGGGGEDDERRGLDYWFERWWSKGGVK